MVGYLLTASELNRDDLSGLAFGTLLESNGITPAYPSLLHPKPGAREFFSGGFITEHYRSKINAIQTELPFEMRTGVNRAMFAKQYAQAIVEFLKANHSRV